MSVFVGFCQMIGMSLIIATIVTFLLFLVNKLLKISWEELQ